MSKLITFTNATEIIPTATGVVFSDIDFESGYLEYELECALREEDEDVRYSLLLEVQYNGLTYITISVDDDSEDGWHDIDIMPDALDDREFLEDLDRECRRNYNESLKGIIGRAISDQLGNVDLMDDDTIKDIMRCRDAYKATHWPERKQFLVEYESVSYMRAFVDAYSAEEAYEIAEEMDESEFHNNIFDGEWRFIGSIDQKSGIMYDKYGNEC